LNQRLPHLYLLGRSATGDPEESTNQPKDKFEHLYLLGRSATYYREDGTAAIMTFQHLYLLGRSATVLTTQLRGERRCFNTFTFWEGLRPHKMSQEGYAAGEFQHLYLLRRSATGRGAKRAWSRLAVSTPLPSEKVCDSTGVNVHAPGGTVSTPLPSEKVCDLLSASLCKPAGSFNTFTF